MSGLSTRCFHSSSRTRQTTGMCPSGSSVLPTFYSCMQPVQRTLAVALSAGRKRVVSLQRSRRIVTVAVAARWHRDLATPQAAHRDCNVERTTELLEA